MRWLCFSASLIISCLLLDHISLSSFYPRLVICYFPRLGVIYILKVTTTNHFWSPEGGGHSRFESSVCWLTAINSLIHESILVQECRGFLKNVAEYRRVELVYEFRKIEIWGREWGRICSNITMQNIVFPIVFSNRITRSCLTSPHNTY